MFEYDGDQYTEQEIIDAASKAGLSFEDYTSKHGIISTAAQEGKTNATAEETAPVVAETPADTDLQLEDGSSELQGNQPQVEKDKPVDAFVATVPFIPRSIQKGMAKFLTVTVPEAIDLGMPVTGATAKFDQAQKYQELINQVKSGKRVTERKDGKYDVINLAGGVSRYDSLDDFYEEYTEKAKQDFKDGAEKYVNSEQYQEIAKLFGEDPKVLDGLTTGEFGELLGTQGGQMVAAGVTLGMSTYAQEAGGMLREIVENKVKSKYNWDKLSNKEKQEKIVEVVENGEIDFSSIEKSAMGIAAIDAASNALGIGKLAARPAGSLFRNLLAKNYKGAVKAFRGDLAKVGQASLLEVPTELTQELVSDMEVSSQLGEDFQVDPEQMAEVAAQTLISSGGLIGSGRIVNRAARNIVKNPFKGNVKEQVAKQREAVDIVYESKLKNIEKLDSNSQEEARAKAKQARDSELTALYEAESIASNSEYRNFEPEAKEKMFDIQIEQQVLRNKNEKLKSSYTGDNVLSAGQMAVNNEKIAELEAEKLKAIGLQIKLNEGNGLRSYINSNPKEFNGYSFLSFKTKKEAEEYIKKQGIEKDENVQALIDGDAYAVKIPGKKLAIDVKETSEKGAIGIGANAVHHEALHMINESISDDGLQNTVSGIKEFVGKSQDETLKAIANYAENRVKTDYAGSSQRVQNEEFMSSVSDMMRQYQIETGNVQGATTLSRLGGRIAEFISKKGPKDFDYSRLENPAEVINFLRKYNSFNGRPKLGLKLNILEDGKVNIEDTEKETLASKSNLQGLLDEADSNTATFINNAMTDSSGDFALNMLDSKFGKEVAPILEDLAKKRFDPIPNDATAVVSENRAEARKMWKEDLLTELIAEVSNKYKPGEQDLDKFVTIRAFQRSNRTAKNIGIQSTIEKGGQGIGVDIDKAKGVDSGDSDFSETDNRSTSEQLGFDDVIKTEATRIVKQAVQDTSNKLTGKDVSEKKKADLRNKFFNNFVEKRILPLVKKAIGKNTKTNKDFTNFVSKNFESLRDIFLDQIDVQKGSGPASLWNIDNPPSLEEFLDYYEGSGTTKSDRRSSLARAVSRSIANEARVEFAKKDPKTAESFKKEHGVSLASKVPLPNQKRFRTLAGIAGFKDGAYNPAQDYWLAAGFDSEIGYDWGTDDGQNKFIKDFKFAVKKGLPLNAFMTKSKLFNSPRQLKELNSLKDKAARVLAKNPTPENKAAYDQATFDRLTASNVFRDKLDKMLAEIKEEGNYSVLTGDGKNWTAKNFITHLGNNPKDIQAKWDDGTIEQFNKSNLSMFEQTMGSLYDLVYKDPSMAQLAFALSPTSYGTSGWFRFGAEVVGYSKDLTSTKDRAIEWEHAMQANNARIFLINSAVNKVDWSTVYPAVKRNYKVIGLDKAYDDVLKAANRGNNMGIGWDVYTGHWTQRYFDPHVVAQGGIDPATIVDFNGQNFADKYSIDANGNSTKAMASKVIFEPNTTGDFNEASTAYKAIFMVGSPGGGKTNVGKGLRLGRRGYKVVNQDIALEALKKAAGLPENESNYNKEQRSLRSKLGSQAVKAGKDKFQQYKNEGKGFLVDGTGASYNATTKKINELKEAGYDVYLVAAMTPKDVAIERNKARKERSLPTFVVSKSYNQVVESLAKYKQDYGDKVFELDTTTIGFGETLPQEFLDKVYNGITQTKVAKSTLDKVAETKVLASKMLSDEFNEILERVKGVKAEARYSEDRANKLAGNKGKFKFFVPYSAEDYVGLIYPTLGKGKEGDRNLQWYKDNIINPFAVGIADFEKAKVESLEQWRDLKKQISKTPAKLNKEAVRGFTNEEALRVYLWNEQDVVPDTLAKKDVEALVKHVEDSKELTAFAENVKDIVGVGGYPVPSNNWLSGSLTIDLIDNINTGKRTEFLQQWQDNVDGVYSKDNMNKLKALYGERYTEALENILYRMKTGRNRPSGATRLENQFMNWVNDSVGTVMFFNTRSALLQTISAVNFLNWSDNNPLMAAKAFANQPRFWKDFADLFNSDFLKSRRSGLKNDINADELAKSAATSDNKVRAGLSALLKAGFLPTQIADSFAISIGGASFYRNRLNTYKKQGLSEEQAKEKAMLDFQETAEESQQSSRPDRVSMQQASSLGRVILAFANTPMQYTRLTKKAALDLVNGRGDWKTNMSKILYYGAVQNIIFTALQQAMFAMLFDDDEIDDEEQTKASAKIVNGIADTFLRGSGVGGAAVATMKNIIMEIIKQKESKRPDYTKAALKLTTLSPPIDTKIRKLMSAGRAFTYRQSLKDMNRLGVDIDNPAALATGQVLSAVANLPADRAILKMRNVKGALDTEHEAWQRIAMGLGFSDWQLGIDKDKSKNDKPKIIKFTKPKSGGVKFVKPGSKKSPTKKLERGVAGRANNDGTIEIDPNLSPVEREKTIAHEKQHMKDMKAGKLNYDDSYVYWNNSKYERKNGKIKYKGKSYIEGHKDLPWEKKAYAAEPSTAQAKKRIKLYA